MPTHLNKFFMKAFIFMFLLISPGLIAATDSSIGKVVFVEGEALSTRVSGETKTLSLNQDLFLKDTVETKKGKLKILFEDSTLLALEENSKIILTEHIFNPKKTNGRKSIFDVIQGRIRSVVEGVSQNTPADIQFRTPTAVAGVRGTELGIIVQGKITTVICFNGLLEAYAKKFPGKPVMLPTGMFTIIGNGLPSKPSKITDLMKQKFSYRYLEYPLIGTRGNDDSTGKVQGRSRTEGTVGGGGDQATSPELPIILPGGASQTPTLVTPSDSGTPAGDPTPFTPTPTPDPTPPTQSPDPVQTPTTVPEPAPVPAPAPTPTPTPAPTDNPPPPSTPPGSGPVTIPLTFPREG